MVDANNCALTQRACSPAPVELDTSPRGCCASTSTNALSVMAAVYSSMSTQMAISPVHATVATREMEWPAPILMNVLWATAAAALFDRASTRLVAAHVVHVQLALLRLEIHCVLTSTSARSTMATAPVSCIVSTLWDRTTAPLFACPPRGSFATRVLLSCVNVRLDTGHSTPASVR